MKLFQYHQTLNHYQVMFHQIVSQTLITLQTAQLKRSIQMQIPFKFAHTSKHLYETWIRDRSWTLSGISGRFERIANKSHTATSNCIRCRIQRMQIPFILSNFTDGRTLFKALAGMYASLVPANCMAGVLDVRNADRSTWSSVFDYSCGLCRFFVGSRCIFRILI